VETHYSFKLEYLGRGRRMCAMEAIPLFPTECPSNIFRRKSSMSQTFLAPILKHPSAQQVLVSFLSDPSKYVRERGDRTERGRKK